MTRPPYDVVAEHDLETLTAQLGRRPRDVVGIPARCVCGNPAVVATKPRLDDGTPFPTFYYLTIKEFVADLSRLEAAGLMVELNALLQSDLKLMADFTRAHRDYLADRAHYGEVPDIAEISAGGMPTRVKCLHALAAHELGAGPGANPIGAFALERCAASLDRCNCPSPGW